MKQEKYPDWFLWAYQKGFVFWLSIAALFGFSMLAVVFHLDHSVQSTEERIHQDLVRVSEEIQEDESEQARQLREIREELDTIREELEAMREAERSRTDAKEH